MEIEKQTIVECVGRLIAESSGFRVVVVWYQTSGDREALCSDLRSSLAAVGAIPYVLRDGKFSDPNAWAADAMLAINELRSEFEGLNRAPDAAIGILILGRTKLSISQSSSPAVMPGWFPCHGGYEVRAVVRDLGVVARCSLGGPELRIEGVCQALFEIERAMLLRFEKLMEMDRHHGQAIWSQLLQKRSGASDLRSFVQMGHSGVQNVLNARSFRPSLRAKWSWVAALWEVFVDVPPAKISSISHSLSGALAISPGIFGGASALIPILFRSANEGDLSIDAKAARDLIVIVGVACQLTTASAHADQYPAVNAALLSSLSVDIREALGKAVVFFGETSH